MKIELTKETGVDKTGVQSVWFWVRAYETDSFCSQRQCFLDEQSARSFYDGLIRHHSSYGTFEDVKEILESKNNHNAL